MYPNFNTAESQQRFLPFDNFEKALFELKIESQIEKQNRMLAHIVNTIAQQEQREKKRYHQTLGQKIKELEIDRTRLNLELERQKFKQLQTLNGSPKKLGKPSVESPTKQASPHLQEVLMGLMSKKKTLPINKNIDALLNPIKSGRDVQEEGDVKSVADTAKSQLGSFKDSILIQDPSLVLPSWPASKRSSLLQAQGQNQMIMENDGNSRGSDNGKRRNAIWSQDDEIMRHSDPEIFELSRIDSSIPKGRRDARMGSWILRTDNRR